MPDFLCQVKEALGLPLAPGPSVVPGPSGATAVAVPGPSSAVPHPVAGPSRAAPAVALPGPPAIVVEDTDSDSGVQTLAVPFRSGSSDAYLPMLSTDDSWTTDNEFRYCFIYYF